MQGNVHKIQGGGGGGGGGGRNPLPTHHSYRTPMPLTVMGNFIVFLVYSIYSLSGHKLVFSPLTTAFKVFISSYCDL